VDQASRVGVEELAVRYSQAWQTRDVDAIVALHAADGVYQLHALGSEPACGREAIRAAFSAAIEMLPDIHFEPVQQLVGERHWVARSRMRGTLAAPVDIDGETVDAPGTSIEVDCVDVIEVESGLVVSKQTYLDTLGFLHQLGGAG
jgi:steroid delta-isomerase-like uncharacterized protein